MLGLAKLLFSLFLTLASLSFAVPAAASCPTPDKAQGFAYSAACIGKPECTVTDFIDISPTAADAKPLLNICVWIGSGAAARPIEVVPNSRTADGRPIPMKLSIGRLVADALASRDGGVDAAMNSPDLLSVLSAATDAKVPATVVTVEEGSGSRASRVPLMLDVTALWVGGTLQPSITRAHCAGSRNCRMGDIVSLEVRHLAAWRKATKVDSGKLVLTTSGVRLAGPPTHYDEVTNTVGFRLSRNASKPESVLAWSDALAQAREGKGSLSVGLADDKGSVTSDRVQISMWTQELMQPWQLGFVAALLVAAAGIYMAGKRYGWLWLRDGCPLGGDTALARQMKFSLARTQMFAWTLVIAFSFAFIGCFLGDWHSFNDTALMLLGLGAGTVLGSVVAESIPDSVTAEVQAYRVAVDANNVAPTASTQQALNSAQVALLNSIGSKRWFSDVTSEDGYRTGVHRLQSLVFTVLFMGFFLIRTVVDGAMPFLSSNELLLLGISGGTYVGFKLASR